jgi:hypothetical protein
MWSRAPGPQASEAPASRLGLRRTQADPERGGRVGWNLRAARLWLGLALIATLYGGLLRYEALVVN